MAIGPDDLAALGAVAAAGFLVGRWTVPLRATVLVLQFEYRRSWWGGWRRSVVVSPAVPLLIRYRDAVGNRTERVVEIARVDVDWVDVGAPRVYAVSGRCRLRDDWRTFLTRRILAAFDPASGEQIYDLWAYAMRRPIRQAVVGAESP